MTDVLTALRIPDPSMYDDYEVVGTWAPPPQAKRIEKGRAVSIVYTATMPSADKYTFEPDKQGFFRVVIDGIIIDGEYVTRKTYLSCQPFKQRDKAGNIIGERKASALGNFFRAFALVVRPSSVAEYEAFALTTADQTCNVTLDWEAYDSDTQTTLVDKWEGFPDDPERPGEKLAYVEQGDKRCWARASIKRFVDAVKG